MPSTAITTSARCRGATIHGEHVDFPRCKTGEPCRVWLWPESRAAIEEVRKPVDPADAHRVFLSKNGTPMVRLHDATWYDVIE